MNQYNSVPNIISCKDLDYLTDIFHWNIGAYKNAVNELNQIQDEEIKQMVQKCSESFKNSIITILNILSGGNNE